MNSATAFKKVLVTGGAGYVGSVLVPRLLSKGYAVRVLDLYIYGGHTLDSVKGNPRLEQLKGDIRDRKVLEKALSGCDAVIHLACISNDPSFELDPALGKSINYDAFLGLVDISKDKGVRRFVYASSSSVYGVKDDPNVTEDMSLLPLTDYSKYKAMCEEVLAKKRAPGFVTLMLRPATVHGYSPRLRLDLTVNILTNHAVNKNLITVLGGSQMRANIHIEDMVDVYTKSLEWPDEAIDGKVFNVGCDNRRVADIAEAVRSVVGEQVKITTAPTNDLRSYRVCSDKIMRELGYEARRSIEYGVKGLVEAFKTGKIPDALTDSRYYNLQRMQELKLR